jgi:hypothetical protein
MKGITMQQATWHESTETPVLSIYGLSAFNAPAFILIYEGATWEVVSESTDPWLNQHAGFYLAETIGSHLPDWDASSETILHEQLSIVLENILNNDGTLKGAN